MSCSNGRKEGGRGRGRALKKADPWLFGAKSLALVSLASGVAGTSSKLQARICHPFDRHSSKTALG